MKTITFIVDVPEPEETLIRNFLKRESVKIQFMSIDVNEVFTPGSTQFKVVVSGPNQLVDKWLAKVGRNPDGSLVNYKQMEMDYQLEQQIGFDLGLTAMFDNTLEQEISMDFPDINSSLENLKEVSKDDTIKELQKEISLLKEQLATQKIRVEIAEDRLRMVCEEYSDQQSEEEE